MDVINAVADVITWMPVGTRQHGIFSVLAIAVAAVILVLLCNETAAGSSKPPADATP